MSGPIDWQVDPLLLQSCLIPAICQALRIQNTRQVLAQGTLLVWVEQRNQLGRMNNG